MTTTREPDIPCRATAQAVVSIAQVEVEPSEATVVVTACAAAVQIHRCAARASATVSYGSVEEL
jgi:hypothetical protein